MFNRETHKSRGFGFIVFELEKGAELTCAEKEHVIDGKVVSCSHILHASSINPFYTKYPKTHTFWSNIVTDN